jgi:glycosyltransferase involved in cell wall biosynthesis
MALKILWLCSWYPNDTDPFDGDFIQRQALAVSTIHSIDVLHVHKQLKSKGPAHYQKNEINTNFTEHIFYNRIRKRNFLFNIYGIFIHTRFIRKNKRPDLIHVQVPMKSGIIALFYKWFYRIPYILTEHNGYYNSYLPDNFSKKSFLYRAITRSVIKHASVFTTVSKSLGEDINTWVLKKEFKVIPNVVDTRLFRFIPKDIKDRFQFIHISNMVPLKNVKGIIEATEELWKLRQDFKVVFVGDLKEEYY